MYLGILPCNEWKSIKCNTTIHGSDHLILHNCTSSRVDPGFSKGKGQGAGEGGHTSIVVTVQSAKCKAHGL